MTPRRGLACPDVPEKLVSPEPEVGFNLDDFRFARKLRSANRGAAGGPSGMTVEHLQPLLGHPRDLRSFIRVCEQLSRARVPRSIGEAILLGRFAALQKPSGSVRGIVAGDIVRRLVARTMSQQLMLEVQNASAPFQYALATKSGCESIAHALQGLTELNPRTTKTSIEGISAYDLISRQAMLERMKGIARGSELPFVSMFMGSPQFIYGKMQLARFTPSRRVKVENRATQ